MLIIEQLNQNCRAELRIRALNRSSSESSLETPALLMKAKEGYNVAFIFNQTINDAKCKVN